MPKVSVIIPCYNQGQYVDEAVNSVLAQTFQDFEIIIVNDGSTDEFTNEILKNYNKPKTKVIHTTNQGLSAARNNGIRESSGEYIVTLDADDLYINTFFEEAINILSKNKEVGVVSSYVELFGSINKIVNSFKSGGLEHYLLYNNTVSCAMFLKECWTKVNGYDEEMKEGFEDWEFWIAITELGWKVHIIEKPLFKYRQKEVSMVTNSYKKRPELIKYIFSKHKIHLQKYLTDAIFLREQIILNQNNQIFEKNKEIENLKQQNHFLRNSHSFKVGNFLLKPFSIIKFFLKNKKNA